MKPRFPSSFPVLAFIVNGVEARLNACCEDRLSELRDLALEQTHNQVRHFAGWEVLSQDGRTLDARKTVGELHLLHGARLFVCLNMGGFSAGRAA